MILRLIPISIIAILFNGCNSCRDNSVYHNDIIKPIPIIDYKYINSYPHDTTSFTEGFLIQDGKLFESTGASRDLPQTKSLFGTVDMTTGKINVKVELDRYKYFGEGIAFINGKVFQLTYKTKVGFIYDATTFKKIKEFIIPSDEGWGLTTNGTYLIMSDGTNILTCLDPDDLHVIKKISVTENGSMKNYLNELEFIKGFIYANIWTTNTIVKIDPKDGKVVGKIDLTAFAYEAKNIYFDALEMNGIAYDSLSDNIYVTGKLWPKVYEIKIN
jgi:glutaminyl-peptide cyclotransferase